MVPDWRRARGPCRSQREEPPGSRRGIGPRGSARPAFGWYDLALSWTPIDSSSELPRLFAGLPALGAPEDRRFAPILDDVGGLARENNLALLNLAASLLVKGESYVEVGSFKGLSLIAAMLGNSGDFVGIDNFSLGGGSRAQLESEPPPLRPRRPHHPGRGRLRASRGGALGDRRVGVYYYDAAHDYRSQVRGLQLIEPISRTARS